MTVFELVGVGACSPGQQLVAHAYSENRFVRLHGFPEVGDGHIAELRVAGTVGDEQTVIFKGVEIEVPRHSDHFNPSLHEAAEDVVLHSAIDHHDSLGALAVFDDFLAADFGNLVLEVRVIDRKILGHSVRYDHSEHRTLLPEKLGDRPGVDAVDSWNLLLLKPLVKALHRIPVTVVKGIVADHHTPDPDPFRLEVARYAILVKPFRWNTIISYQWVGYTKDLS